MKRIKILHFIHSLVSGGAEKQLRLLCQHIDKSQFDVAIFCVNHHGHDITDPAVKIYANLFPNLLSPKFISSINKCLTEFNPDIVHAWLPQSVSIPAIILSRIHKKPIIFSYRNRMTFQRPLAYVEFVTAALFSNRIVSNRSVEDSLLPFRWLFNLKQGCTIANAVFIPKEISNSTAPKLSKPLRFICIGRLTKQKNFPALIKALATLKDSANWKLDIFGDGEDKHPISQLVSELALEKQISIRGFSYNVYSEMACANALIFPSLYEGMPNVLIEALQIGLPVIASDIHANRAIINNGAAVVWFNPRDELSIARAIDCFLQKSPQAIETMIAQGKEIASNYTLSRMLNQYQNYYKAYYDEKN